MPVVVRGPDGSPEDPGAAVTPIFVEKSPGVLAVLGTGFYITRYGLVLTAKHVAEGLAGPTTGTLRPAWTWHFPNESQLVLRSIRTVTYDTRSPTGFPDLAVLQADNYCDPNARTALMNSRIALSLSVPAPSARIATYAYPGNGEMRFQSKDEPVPLFADFFEGEFLEVVPADEHPLLRYRHFRAAMDIRSGASGGPVFGPDGHAFAVNCRSWDLEDGSHLASLVPSDAFLALEVGGTIIPPWSAEFAAIPQDRRGRTLTGRDLVEFGHVTLVGS